MGRKKKEIIEEVIKTEVVETQEVIEPKQIDYSPLSKEDYNWLVEVLPNNKVRLQVKDAVKLWNLKNTLERKVEPRPCLCKSSGHHWLRCLTVLNNYVNKIKNV